MCRSQPTSFAELAIARRSSRSTAARERRYRTTSRQGSNDPDTATEFNNEYDPHRSVENILGVYPALGSSSRRRCCSILRGRAISTELLSRPCDSPRSYPDQDSPRSLTTDPENHLSRFSLNPGPMQFLKCTPADSQAQIALVMPSGDWLSTAMQALAGVSGFHSSPPDPEAPVLANQQNASQSHLAASC